MKLNNPVRLILKKIKTDSNGQLINAGYKTIEVDNEELEELLFSASPHRDGKFEVVGAELINEDKLYKKHQEVHSLEF